MTDKLVFRFENVILNVNEYRSECILLVICVVVMLHISQKIELQVQMYWCIYVTSVIWSMNVF
jgi:hypothetical protein